MVRCYVAEPLLSSINRQPREVIIFLNFRVAKTTSFFNKLKFKKLNTIRTRNRLVIKFKYIKYTESYITSIIRVAVRGVMYVLVHCATIVVPQRKNYVNMLPSVGNLKKKLTIQRTEKTVRRRVEKIKYKNVCQ